MDRRGKNSGLQVWAYGENPLDWADWPGASLLNMLLDRLLTPKEVAETLGVSVAWVLDHSSRRRPLLPSVKLGKAVRFRREEVEEFIRECARIKGAAT
jgi:excisionase family DNA binding protein